MMTTFVLILFLWSFLFLLSSGYDEYHNNITVGGRTAPVQIAFGVMTFHRDNDTINETLEDFYRLMNRIYEDEYNHLYVLHTDYSSPSRLHQSISNDFCSHRLNCLTIEPRIITWGGVSVVEMNLALMHAAHEFVYPNGSSSSWEYFALLGHESMPLVSLQYIESFLLSYPLGTNFINCWDGDGYDFFGQHEDIIYRQASVVVDGFDEKRLHENFDIERKVPRGMKLYKTIQYVVISRDFVRSVNCSCCCYCCCCYIIVLDCIMLIVPFACYIFIYSSQHVRILLFNGWL